MAQFAKASQILLQPQAPTRNSSWDDTNPRRSPNDQPIDINIANTVQTATSSLYGNIERWDILRLGHCGNIFPDPPDEKLPLGRVPIFNDPTVAEPHLIKNEFGNREFYDAYPAHTRLVHHTKRSVCTLAYAMTLQAAARIVYEFGVNMGGLNFDMLLQRMCDGTEGLDAATCLTVQRSLFEHHRRLDVSWFAATGDRRMPYSPNIRWSTKLNAGKLVKGDIDYEDQLPDGSEQPWWIHE